MRLCFVSLSALAFLFGANATLTVNLGEVVILSPENWPHVVLRRKKSLPCYKFAPLAPKNFPGPYVFDSTVGNIQIDKVVLRNLDNVHIPLQPTRVDIRILPRIEDANRLYNTIHRVGDENLKLCEKLRRISAGYPSQCGDTCDDLYNRHHFLAHYYTELLPLLRGNDNDQHFQDALEVTNCVVLASSSLEEKNLQLNFDKALGEAARYSSRANALAGPRPRRTIS